LTPEGGQQHQLALRAEALHFPDFTRDDFLHALGRDRLDVSPVGKLRVGHDRGRIGIHQDDAIALLFQRLAGLRARVIELASLANDDRPGANDQNGMNVGAFRHKTA
jgi:hypothetical protein